MAFRIPERATVRAASALSDSVCTTDFKSAQTKSKRAPALETGEGSEGSKYWLNYPRGGCSSLPQGNSACPWGAAAPDCPYTSVRPSASLSACRKPAGRHVYELDDRAESDGRDSAERVYHAGYARRAAARQLRLAAENWRERRRCRCRTDARPAGEVEVTARRRIDRQASDSSSIR
jgi:hypothetical protein